MAWDDSSNEIILTGRFNGALHIGDALASAGNFDAFVAKLNQDGTGMDVFVAKLAPW